MTDTRSQQPIDMQRTYFPTSGMCTHGVRVNIEGWGWRALRWHDRLAAGAGGKSAVNPRAPHPPSHILPLIPAGLDLIFGRKTFGNSGDHSL